MQDAATAVIVPISPIFSMQSATHPDSSLTALQPLLWREGVWVKHELPCRRIKSSLLLPLSDSTS